MTEKRDLRMWNYDWMQTVMSATISYMVECVASRNWQECATVMGTTAAVMQAALSDDREMLNRASEQLDRFQKAANGD